MYLFFALAINFNFIDSKVFFVAAPLWVEKRKKKEEQNKINGETTDETRDITAAIVVRTHHESPGTRLSRISACHYRQPQWLRQDAFRIVWLTR